MNHRLSTVAEILRDRLLAGAPVIWSELVSEYEDEDNYLSLSLTAQPGATAVALVEFGVQDASQRHAVGVLQAEWRRQERVLGPVEMILLDSTPCGMPQFMTRLHGYLQLPATFEEAVDHAA